MLLIIKLSVGRRLIINIVSLYTVSKKSKVYKLQHSAVLIVIVHHVTAIKRFTQQMMGIKVREQKKIKYISLTLVLPPINTCKILATRSTQNR